MDFPHGLNHTQIQVPDDYTYLRKLDSLKAYPALRPFLAKLLNFNEYGRRLVEDQYRRTQQRSPGRCTMLTFNDDSVEQPEQFDSAGELDAYLEKSPSTPETRRLFILEDMEARFVDRLGHHLDVDPLVFSEQMNTWNFTDAQSIPFRQLPSLHSSEKSFNVRYYEVRTLTDASSVDFDTSQTTLALNRRKYERWRDIDTPSAPTPERHAFVRRCASFWTSETTPKHGWDAVLLVDPGMRLASTETPGQASCYILQDPVRYTQRSAMWLSRGWEARGSVEAREHYSRPYHEGCPTLAPLLMSDAGQTHLFTSARDVCSLFDELVFYWTKVASPALIKKAYEQPSNTAYYLLKYVAYHWTNQLDLICCGVASAEYFADDHEAAVNVSTSKEWQEALTVVNSTAKDINYMRRQMSHFERAMTMNLERLDVQLGNEAVDTTLPKALQDAQKDFLVINARLKPFRERVDDLAGVANELANLRAAFKSIQDGEFGLRLSIFASIVFPLTLVASILSMGGHFGPGQSHFWIFWAASLPFTLIFALLLVYGNKPYKALLMYGNNPHKALEDLRAYTKISPQTSRFKKKV